MRYVDIDDLSLALPHGWLQRAQNALNDLRAEIVAAEQAAIAAGEGVSTARKKAIAAGVSKPARMAIWQDLNLPASGVMNGKCWYSESKNPTADKNVDHFRPKGRVDDDPTHEGYWWLAFDWRNYRYVSQWCNQRRIDKQNGTAGGKGDHFPIPAGKFRARLEADDTGQEEPLLIDPTVPDEWKLITFRQDGHPVPAYPPGTPEHDRAALSIDIYHLHCAELVTERRIVASQITRIIESMESLRPLAPTNLTIRGQLFERQKELLRAIRPNAEYSAAALAFAKAEVYKLVAGHQVKREWLAEMLAL
jgi:hypothetical protein